MSDYIKREDAIFIALQQPLYSVVSQIKQLEGIDIVRCKECRHWVGNISEDDGIYEDECKWITEEAPNADDFCSYGERNE